MQNIKRMITFDNLVGIIATRRWYIIIPVCLSLLGGIYLTFITPRIYEASTLILVQPQQVPRNYVRPLTSMDINARIGSITQQIRSRSNLEKVIKKFNLFSDPKYKKMFIIEKIDALNKLITISVMRSRGQDSFSIKFRGKEPGLVMKITNYLATMFIDENLKIREQQATGTDNFLDSELKAIRERLVENEKVLMQYRQKYRGELPEQLQTNVSMFTQKQRAMFEKQAAVRDVKASLSRIETQMQMITTNASENSNIQGDGSLSSSGNLLINENGESTQLTELKSQLKNLKLKYTESHPDVIRLKESIKKLESKEERTTSKLEDNETILPLTDFQIILVGHRDELKNELKRLNEEIAELQQQINLYEQRIENTQQREQELISITRDYENVKATYNSLLNRKLEAEIAVNMEKKQKGEQFHILDYAEMPEKPIAPDPKKFLLLSLAAGLAIGAGLIYVLEFLSTSIKQQEDIEIDLGIAVLATVPKIYHQRAKIWEKLNFALTICSLVIAFFLVIGFAILVKKGIDPTIAYVQYLLKI